MKTLYENGQIITMDEDNSTVQALLEENGRITAVGETQVLRDLAGKALRHVDLAGAVLCPAFIDPHSHLLAVASGMLTVDLTGVTSREAVRSAVQRGIAVQGIEPGGFVICQQFDPEHMGGYPALAELDAMAPGYAIVLLHASGHAGMLSTAALERAGITADMPDPVGGHIKREGGRLTGYLEENALFMAQRVFPQPELDALLGAAERAQALYLENGITTAQEGLLTAEMLPLYRELVRREALHMDVVGYAEPQQYDAYRAAFSRNIGGYDRHFRLGGIKLILDGSPQARTAYLSAPYLDAADGYRGYPALSMQETVDALLMASGAGAQLLAHCNGDAAAQQFIDACREAARRGADLARVHPVMIHAQLLRIDQMDDLRALGITPSFFAAHVYHWGETHRRNLGQARAERISPLHSAKAHGLPFTLHQDAPVIRPDMMETLWTACMRLTDAGHVLGTQERIDAADALRAVTVHAARQYGEADKGMLRAGCRADMVLLSANPLEVPAGMLRDIRVLRTWCEGKPLFPESV